MNPNNNGKKKFFILLLISIVIGIVVFLLPLTGVLAKIQFQLAILSIVAIQLILVLFTQKK